MEPESMSATDLCVPIYLNQQMVFDLLAVLEDGFYQLSDIKTAATESQAQRSGAGASIGISNVFALLGVAFKGEHNREKGSGENTEVTRERIHTPTSLFSKLRLTLINKSLLTRVQSEEDFGSLASGHFVEFGAVLRKNPLVETIEGFQQLMKMAELFSDEPERPAQQGGGGKGARGKGKGSRGAGPRNENELIAQQMEGMLSALTQTGSLEIIGEMLDSQPAKAVLSTKPEYFSDQSASEIVDGEFRVLGKVIRVIDAESEETINLLRKTSFGHLDNRLFAQLGDAFEDQEDVGLRFPDLVTEIEGPALQIAPMAIFT